MYMPHPVSLSHSVIDVHTTRTFSLLLALTTPTIKLTSIEISEPLYFWLVCDANLYCRLTCSALIGVQFSGAVESWHLVVISLDGAPLRAPSALVLICESAVPLTLTYRSEPVHGSLFNCMLTSFVQHLPPPALQTSLQ